MRAEVQKALIGDPRLIQWPSPVGRFVPLAWVQKHLPNARPPIAVAGLPGLADASGVLLDGRAAFIEYKSPTGTLRPAQKTFQAVVEKRGALYVVARSGADVLKALDGS